jgi:HTH-type transcriptional regulator/antitoxin HigA
MDPRLKRDSQDVADLAPVWRAFESRAPVRLRTISSQRHYRAMSQFMERLLDVVGDDEKHPLCGLLDVVTALVDDYERRNHQAPDATPAEALRLLMEQHALRQVDLAAVFGAQSNVSEVLSGKRSINARQARALAERFGVSPAAFI